MQPNPADLLARLHDATLLSVVLDWESGVARLQLRTSIAAAEHAAIEAHGVSRLVCPRQFPWGKSVSINEVRGPVASDAGCTRVEIEMQSGDVLVLEANAINVVHHSEPSNSDATA